MDVRLFEKCIRYITRNFDVVLFEDYAFGNSVKTNNKIASIMFDDGYEDNIIYAAPILQKYNCKASFYIVTDSIDKNLPIWTYLIDYLFQKTGRTAINLDYAFLPELLRVMRLDSYAERIIYVRRLKPFLKKIPQSWREVIVSEIMNAYNDVQVSGEMMNWDQVRQLRAAGHYIGSHTVTHPVLGMIEENSAVTEELFLSGQKIKDKVGYFPVSISYPVGSYNLNIKKVAQEVGYKTGLAVNQKPYKPGKQDLFEVPRIELYNEPWWKTKLRISNRIEQLKSVIY